MANSAKRPIAALQMSKLLRIGDFTLKAMAITEDIDANPTLFVTPEPKTADVKADVTELGKAEIKVQTRVPGAAAARDIIYNKVKLDVMGLMGYVQRLADKTGNEQDAIALILASGFDLKNRGVRVKPDLSAKHGKVSGLVKLAAKAESKRASYNWQQSADNGTTWLSLPPTLMAKTSVAGLTPGVRMLFRFQSVTKAGISDWCQPVSIIVI